MRPVCRIYDWVVFLYKLDYYYVIVIFRMKFIFRHASVGGKVSVLTFRLAPCKHWDSTAMLTRPEYKPVIIMVITILS